jgi:hypothetical protein
MRRTEEFGLNATMEHHWHNPIGPVERGTDFLRLANARALDAMLLAAPR